MHSGFNLLVFPNSMLTPFFIYERAMVLSGEITLKNNLYYYVLFSIILFQSLTLLRILSFFIVLFVILTMIHQLLSDCSML